MIDERISKKKNINKIIKLKKNDHHPMVYILGSHMTLKKNPYTERI